MMRISIEIDRCNGCRACEFACSYHYDREFTTISSSLIVHRDELKNYYGIVLKRQNDIYVARPEGEEYLRPGERMGDTSATDKPIMMRPSCDMCEDEDRMFCVDMCPMGCIRVVE